MTRLQHFNSNQGHCMGVTLVLQHLALTVVWTCFLQLDFFWELRIVITSPRALQKLLDNSIKLHSVERKGLMEVFDEFDNRNFGMQMHSHLTHQICVHSARPFALLTALTPCL